MRLYLDEDIASRELVVALTNAGQDVSTPLGANLVGESDVLQLTHAVREDRIEDRIFVTKNYRDFRQLHTLVIECAGSHPGIFALRSDNDRRRDMKLGQIVNAMNNVMTILSSVRDHLLCLNEWR